MENKKYFLNENLNIKKCTADERLWRISDIWFKITIKKTISSYKETIKGKIFIY